LPYQEKGSFGEDRKMRVKKSDWGYSIIDDGHEIFHGDWETMTGYLRERLGGANKIDPIIESLYDAMSLTDDIAYEELTDIIKMLERLR
jgi:hypothetical protein